MRILATTDFHGNAEAFRKTTLKAKLYHVDVVVVCGDITHFGSHPERF
ncbi:MAG: metallophosphoesterase [Candidatus Bathyarchaeota archaeon]|nr:metallophosphoesterase [Candidatus Bathyarchaeota archaeon]